jgi:hypothetical protein
MAASSVKQMIEAANEVVPRITPEQGREMLLAKKSDTLVKRARLAWHVGISR